MISIRIDNLKTGEAETLYINGVSKIGNRLTCFDATNKIKALAPLALLKTRILIENGKLYTLIG